MAQDSTFGIYPDRLARLLAIGSADVPLSGDRPAEQAAADLLHDRLAGPLPLDEAVVDSLPVLLGRLSRELLPLAGRSLADVLLDPATKPGSGEGPSSRPAGAASQPAGLASLKAGKPPEDLPTERTGSVLPIVLWSVGGVVIASVLLGLWAKSRFARPITVRLTVSREETEEPARCSRPKAESILEGSHEPPNTFYPPHSKETPQVPIAHFT